LGGAGAGGGRGRGRHRSLRGEKTSLTGGHDERKEAPGKTGVLSSNSKNQVRGWGKCKGGGNEWGKRSTGNTVFQEGRSFKALRRRLSVQNLTGVALLEGGEGGREGGDRSVTWGKKEVG